MTIRYPESEGARRALHTFMLASADIECRDAIEQSEFIEGVEYFLAMFRPPKSKRRGGRPVSQRVQEQHELVREFTNLQPGKQSKRIRLARVKFERYAAEGWPHEHDKPENTGNPERDLLRKMMRTGVKLPSARWHREILKQRRAKKVGS
jgi:hypothetical protein